MTPTQQALNALDRIARQCDAMREGLMLNRADIDRAFIARDIPNADVAPAVHRLCSLLHAASYEADHLHHLLTDKPDKP